MCPICVGRGVVDTTRTEWVGGGDEVNAGPRFVGKQLSPQQMAQALADEMAAQSSIPARSSEIYERNICPACFGLGSNQRSSPLLDDALLLWFLTREECPSRPLESFRCQACKVDYPLTESYFRYIPPTRHGRLDQDVEANVLSSNMKKYWATQDPKKRARILREYKMEVIFFCEDTTCGARYSEYPTYIPPISNQERYLFDMMDPSKSQGLGLKEYRDGFKPLDTLLGNLCQKCGIGQISVWFGFVDTPKREAVATAGDAICSCGSALEYVESALEKIPKRAMVHRWRECGDRLVATRHLRLTPLAEENGVATIRFFDSGWHNVKGNHYDPDPRLEEFLEELRERHVLYGELASTFERFYYEKYQVRMEKFRADLFNPALASTEQWRRTFLGY